MYGDVISHLRGLYGLDPDASPFALQFPRLPPSVSDPMARVHRHGGLGPRAERLGPRLQDYREAYQRLASGLLDSGSPMTPPGHPLYSARGSAEALRTENARLKKENTDLRRQLDVRDETPRHDAYP